jgi:hypothetical protein
MHRAPIRMGEAEWAQPQTRRIIRAAVDFCLTCGSVLQACGPRSRAIGVCQAAQVTSVTN